MFNFSNIFRPLREAVRSSDTGWGPKFYTTTQTLADGTMRDGLLMRRRQQGVWVHRLPTGREIDDYVFGDAWWPTRQRTPEVGFTGSPDRS